MCEEMSPWHLRQRYNISRQSPCVTAGLAGEEVVGLAGVGGEVVELGDGVLPGLYAGLPGAPRGALDRGDKLVLAVPYGDRRPQSLLHHQFPPGASAIEPRGELIPAVGCSDRREGDSEERSHGAKEVNVRHQMIHHLALRDHSR